MAAISEVINTHRDGTVDYVVRIYVGLHAVDRIWRVTCRTDEWIPRRWRLSPAARAGLWELHIRRIRPGTALFFRLEMDDGASLPFVPIGESDVVNGIVRVPDWQPDWLRPELREHDDRPPSMAILLEQTLEGLLAEHEDGVYFTDAIEELLAWSVADRLLQTRIPEAIRDLGYTEIMFPLYASVADRCHLNPKYNYLVYNLSVDWQLGSAKDLRLLVHRFRAVGIELVPDLVFVHQVRNPFAGSSDDLAGSTHGLCPWQDPDPFLFRNYGTWHFDLEDPTMREIVIDKILEAILVCDFRVVRVDYIDGLIMQYSARHINYGAVLLRELKQRLQQNAPRLRIIGEAFQTAADPAVHSLIDSAYLPRAFSLLDLLISPPSDIASATRIAVDGLTRIVTSANHQTRAESNYSQLHDECWEDPWIVHGRPHTPWAYGAMPMALSLKRVDEWIHQSALGPDQRIATAVSLTLLIRTLGVALSFSRWMETSGCLSLDQGRLDEPNHWRFPWNTASGLSRKLFPAEELDERQRQDLIIHARAHVAAVNRVILNLGISRPGPLRLPLCMVHGDVNTGLTGFVRWGCQSPKPALVLVNLSPVEAAGERGYEVDLSGAGWPEAWAPHRLEARTPSRSNAGGLPLVLSNSHGGSWRYQLNRPLEGYESVLFEVPADDR